MTPLSTTSIPLTGSLLGMASSWALVALGVAHIAFGIIKFRAPLRDALTSGFVRRFAEPELRRTAFWSVMFGLPLLLAGHVAVRAAGRADHELLGLVGGYVFAASLIGVLAFPRSPFLGSIIVSVMLILAGQCFQVHRPAVALLATHVAQSAR